MRKKERFKDMNIKNIKLTYRKLKWLYRRWQGKEHLQVNGVQKEKIRLLDIKDKKGWVSPTYFKSRAIQLNPLTLEKNRCIAPSSERPEVIPYKILRHQLTRAVDELGGNTIMVTSALPGEGKTLTAINLAFIFARKFEHTVLLVDCDLKKQDIHQVLGYESDNGLVNYLLNECAMTDLIAWPTCREKLTIVSGGKIIDESSAVLGSPWMQELFTDIKGRYPERILIFDLPPVLAAADAMIFAKLVDHIVVVVEADKTSMVDLKAALELLPREKIRGLILNRMHSSVKSEYPYPHSQEDAFY
jgi:non-specific protein-tyrosine kinase